MCFSAGFYICLQDAAFSVDCTSAAAQTADHSTPLQGMSEKTPRILRTQEPRIMEQSSEARCIHVQARKRTWSLQFVMEYAFSVKNLLDCR